jgi:hypothetical protein
MTGNGILAADYAWRCLREKATAALPGWTSSLNHEGSKADSCKVIGE